MFVSNATREDRSFDVAVSMHCLFAFAMQSCIVLKTYRIQRQPCRAAMAIRSSAAMRTLSLNFKTTVFE